MAEGQDLSGSSLVAHPRWSRRRVLGIALGGAAAVLAAGATGIELVSHGVLPGASVLDELDGACSVTSPPFELSALGPSFSSTFYSRARNRTVGYTIAYPPGHRSGDELPLVVMLHGYGANHANALAGLSPAQAVALRVAGRPLAPIRPPTPARTPRPRPLPPTMPSPTPLRWHASRFVSPRATTTPSTQASKPWRAPYPPARSWSSARAATPAPSSESRSLCRWPSSPSTSSAGLFGLEAALTDWPGPGSNAGLELRLDSLRQLLESRYPPWSAVRRPLTVCRPWSTP
jgi:hypothetical protein